MWLEDSSVLYSTDCKWPALLRAFAAPVMAPFSPRLWKPFKDQESRLHNVCLEANPSQALDWKCCWWCMCVMIVCVRPCPDKNGGNLHRHGCLKNHPARASQHCVTVARCTPVCTHPGQPQCGHFFKHFFFSSGRGNMESTSFLESERRMSQWPTWMWFHAVLRNSAPTLNSHPNLCSRITPRKLPRLPFPQNSPAPCFVVLAGFCSYSFSFSWWNDPSI